MSFLKQYSIPLVVILPLLISCQTAPQNVNVALPKSLPAAKVTAFNQAIYDMGTMSTIYSDQPLRIMANEIVDNTGTSVATSAEIPRDITAMVKSTLNGFGGNIRFIPYDPNFMANSMNTGYTNFENKIIPDIIVDGGITEFDRGLETKGDSTEADVSGTWGGGKAFGFSMEDSNKASAARITLDFNLIDFQTFSGIPQMQAINSMKLHKAVKKDAVGITLFSSTFGAQGTVKKVQGRHAAVRMLVQLSMLQVVGKYQNIPYWRLLSGSKRDVNLLNRVIDDYYSLPNHLRVARLQVFLALNGHPVQVNGNMDSSTQAAKQAIMTKYDLSSDSNDAKIFITAYENVPLSRENKHKSQRLFQQFAQLAQSGASSTVAVAQPRVKAKPAAPKEVPFSGNINLWSNQKEYNLGQQMTVSFTVDKPMYVKLAVISSDGSVATLFPNPYQDDNFAKPGVTYQIPPKGVETFTLDIGEPKGVDKIRAFGTKAPVVASQVSYSPEGKLDKNKIRVKVVEAATDIRIK